MANIKLNIELTENGLVTGTWEEEEIIEPIPPEPEPTPPGILVGSDVAFYEAVKNSVEGDVILLAPGDYGYLNWPKDTSHKLMVSSLERANPARVKGLYGGNGEAYPWQPDNTGGKKFSNVTFDGINFRPDVLMHFTDQNGNKTSILGPDGKGYGWRADYSFPRVTNTGENAGFVGIKFGSGCNNNTVVNCLFEHYAKCINNNGTNNAIRHCDFSMICEDAFINWGGDNFTFTYNRWINSRGVPIDVAKKFGWGNSEPPHQDFGQVACNSSGQWMDGLKFSYNTIDDDTIRVHGLLVNNSYVVNNPGALGSRHKNVTVRNNDMRVTHTTAIQVTNTVGCTIDSNKVVRTREDPNSTKNDVAIIVGGWKVADAESMEDVTVTQNVCRKYKPYAEGTEGWTWTDNLTTNDPAIVPADWQPIREDEVNVGDKFAGRYGAEGKK